MGRVNRELGFWGFCASQLTWFSTGLGCLFAKKTQVPVAAADEKQGIRDHIQNETGNPAEITTTKSTP